MSKSLARVEAVLLASGVPHRIHEMQVETRTAQQAAQAVGCTLDQIAKSLLFVGAASGNLYLFLTAGGRQIDLEQAAAVAGEALQRADARMVREVTGFAIGGVAPVGHLRPLPVFMDRSLMPFRTIWAAAGTPRHVFSVAPAALASLSSALQADFSVAEIT